MPRTRKGGEWEKNSSPFKKGVDMVYSQKKKSNQKQPRQEREAAFPEPKDPGSLETKYPDPSASGDVSVSSASKPELDSEEGELTFQ